MKPLKKISTDKIFSFFLFLLITSGLWNYIFASTPLVAWKQIIILITYIILFNIKKSEFTSKLFYFLFIIQLIFILTSLIQGVSLFITLFNIFFYVAWIPFFLWSTNGGSEYFNKNYSRYTLILLIICAIGLYVDLKTDYLSFLAISNADISNDFYEKFDVAKRSSFIFVTSTLVMPVIGALTVIVITQKYSNFRLIMCILSILIAAVSTASTSAFFISGFLLIGIVGNNIKLSRFFIISIIITIITLFSQIIISKDDTLSRQISRVTENRDTKSEANSGRFSSWGISINTIKKFSIIEHAVGQGLGATNNQYNPSVLTQGESSFFQAYIEGGIVGLFLRLFPFLLIIYLFFRYKNNNTFLLMSYFLGIFIAVAIAPIFGNIPSQALLGFLAGSLVKKNTKNQVIYFGNIKILAMPGNYKNQQ